jgi:hypothetical protein
MRQVDVKPQRKLESILASSSPPDLGLAEELKALMAEISR